MWGTVVPPMTRDETDDELRARLLYVCDESHIERLQGKALDETASRFNLKRRRVQS